jgi:hypothetical protein
VGDVRLGEKRLPAALDPDQLIELLDLVGHADVERVVLQGAGVFD